MGALSYDRGEYKHFTLFLRSQNQLHCLSSWPIFAKIPNFTGLKYYLTLTRHSIMQRYLLCLLAFYDASCRFVQNLVVKLHLSLHTPPPSPANSSFLRSRKPWEVRKGRGRLLSEITSARNCWAAPLKFLERSQTNCRWIPQHMVKAQFL